MDGETDVAPCGSHATPREEMGSAAGGPGYPLRARHPQRAPCRRDTKGRAAKPGQRGPFSPWTVAVEPAISPRRDNGSLHLAHDDARCKPACPSEVYRVQVVASGRVALLRTSSLRVFGSARVCESRPPRGRSWARQAGPEKCRTTGASCATCGLMS